MKEEFVAKIVIACAWMNCKIFQLWRFVVLNLKILKAVDRSKRA